MAFVLSEEIQRLAREVGIQRLGFLTLTFEDHVTDIREAQRRFHSLRVHVISKRYAKSIGVWERQGSGRIHFHLVVTLDVDIRTGFDFEAVKKKDYRSAGQGIRGEWAYWRKTAPSYGFGRTELLPVRSTAEGIARYVGGYISKHIEQRREADKGARVIRFMGFTQGDRRFNSRFAWVTNNSWLWRQKVASFARRSGVESIAQLADIFGRRWAWALYETIMDEQVSDVAEASEAKAALRFQDRASVRFRRVEAEEKKPDPATSVCYQLQPPERYVRLGRTKRGDSAATALAIPPRLGQQSFSMPGLESALVDRKGFPILERPASGSVSGAVELRPPAILRVESSLSAYEHVTRRIPVC